jgi:hypothetical protein
VALAESDRLNVVTFDNATVNVANAEIVIYLVFCDRIETVFASDALIVLYKVSALPIVTAKVAFTDNERYHVVRRESNTVNGNDTDNVRYPCFTIETVNVEDALMIFVGIFESAAVKVAFDDNDLYLVANRASVGANVAFTESVR